MKVIIEAITKDDINAFLMSEDILEFAEKATNSRAICMKILSECGKKYKDTKLPHMRTVSIFKVNQDNTMDILSSDHTVLEYDGYFYDYNAKEFQDSFKDDISYVIPCVQRVINNEESITRFDSNIKGYSIVGGGV